MESRLLVEMVSSTLFISHHDVNFQPSPNTKQFPTSYSYHSSPNISFRSQIKTESKKIANEICDSTEVNGGGADVQSYRHLSAGWKREEEGKGIAYFSI